jgi:FkbM family methyltransferase
MKSAIKKLFSAVGLEVQRSRQSISPDSRFGLQVLRLVVEDMLKCREPSEVLLLQVGANDGVQEDPVRPLLERYPIRAFLCEPLSDVFQRLSENYAAYKHVTPLNCAVGKESGELTIYRFAENQTNYTEQLVASFDRRNVERLRVAWGLPESAIVSETVPCYSVPDVLRQMGEARIDIACVDAEGLDHVICNALLDLLAPPTIVHFEYNNSPTNAVQELLERMVAMGYLFARSGLDFTAVRQAK